MIPRDTTVVVPCFNEEHRIVEDEFVSLARRSALKLLFVDDGSTDKTGAVLERMTIDTDAIEVLHLDANRGKAEAVRRGMLLAVRHGASVVGYFDADLATPTNELERLSQLMYERRHLAGAFGSRISCLGSTIDRSLNRHYMGRIYATVAALALGTPVYDTQCGAKLFRVTPSLVAALSQPFRSSWSFDVELIDRLLRGGPGVRPVPAGAFVEMPLETWRDVDGSKLRTTEALAAFTFLLRMAYRRSRGKGGRMATEGATVSALAARETSRRTHRDADEGDGPGAVPENARSAPGVVRSLAEAVARPADVEEL